MARTRSATKLGEQPGQAGTNGADGPPSSFNGRLEQFAFGGRGESTASTTQHSVTITASDGENSRKRKRITEPAKAPTTASKAATNFKKPRATSNGQSSKYAPPSKYAHLSPLTDILTPNLIAVFVGFNPGIQTATQGHAYAHPSNLFWKLLHSSGLTERRLRPDEDGTLPEKYALGNTNLVSRPSRDTAELSKDEQVAAVPVLEAKIRAFRPEAVCIVGKSIWENIWHSRHGRKMKKGEFKYGWQDERERMGGVGEGAGGEGETWEGARVFVTTSTSGLSAGLSRTEKEEIWRPFGEWVQQRRVERAEHRDT